MKSDNLKNVHESNYRHFERGKTMEEVKDTQPEKSQNHNRKQPLPRTREEGIEQLKRIF